MHLDVQPRVLPDHSTFYRGYSFDTDGKSTYALFKCFVRGNFSVQDDIKKMKYKLSISFLFSDGQSHQLF